MHEQNSASVQPYVKAEATPGVAPTEKVQMPEKARAGIEVLHRVVESLLTTSRYVDEEGEATMALADLSDCIADPPFKLASGVAPTSEAQLVGWQFRYVFEDQGNRRAEWSTVLDGEPSFTSGYRSYNGWKRRYYHEVRRVYAAPVEPYVEDPHHKPPTSGVPEPRKLDPNRAQICRVAPIAYDNGQPCICPEGTCNLWKGGLRPAGVTGESQGEEQ